MNKDNNGPYAEFGIIDIIDKTIDYGYYNPYGYNCISIPDDIIENWYPDISKMKSYFHSFSRPETGLARWGVTLIPPESLDFFHDIIQTKTSAVYREKFSSELNALLGLVKKAKENEKYMIHFGV